MKNLGKKLLILVFAFSMLSSILLTEHPILVDAAKNEENITNDDPEQFRANGIISDDFYSDTVQMKKVDAAANVYTGSVYTHNSAFDSLGIVNGIDVSQWQGAIDWAKVKAAGIEYAFIRVGYRGYGSAGNMGDDTYYQQNMAGAAAAGIKIGVYIYSQAITATEAEEEAQYILDRLGSYTISMPLVLDYEYAGTGVGRLYNARLSKAAATKVCLAFCNKIAASGYTPMVYANATMLTNQLNASEISASYPIWLANYTTKSDYAGTYTFWQYSSKGSVSGIKGDVDMNFWYTNDTQCYGSKNDMVVNGITDMTYVGQPVIPGFSVTFGGNTLVCGTDYTYTVTNNVEIGTASIAITGIGNYAGYAKTVTFRIVAPSVSDFRAGTTTKTSVTLNWTPNTSVSGYVIYRATTINGTYKKVKTISNNATSSYKQSKLTSGKEYYYKICPFVNTAANVINGVESNIVTARVKNSYTRKLYTNKKYTLRASTASGAASIVTVPKKSLLTITSHTLNKSGATWYYVTYKAKGTTYRGYIPKAKGSLYRYGKVTSTSLNVRSGASTKKSVVVVLKKNKKVTILSTKKDSSGESWYKINVTKGKYTYSGYVSSKHIKLY